MRSILSSLPATILAGFLAVMSAHASVGHDGMGSRDGASQGRRVVASGSLTGTRERQQVIVWQTAGLAHLAVETIGSHPGVLWQIDSANSESRVDSVQLSDLDADGIPEIISLWWKTSPGAATLRVFHWVKQTRTFVEVEPEGTKPSPRISAVQSYSLGAVQGRTRILVFTTKTRGKHAVPDEQFEISGDRLTRLSGGIIRVDLESGIEGQAIISPATPGPLRAGTSGSAPYKTTIVVWNAKNDKEIARVETGSDGRFRLVLPPGEYKVGPPRQTGRFLPRGGEETVTIAPGKFAQVTINFDSGMR